jgi:hypothetical protein
VLNCFVATRSGFHVLGLEQDSEKSQPDVLVFKFFLKRNLFYLLRFINLTTIFAVRMEHLLTSKSFKGMVWKLSFNMEILCHLLVHQSMVNLFI